MGRTTYIPREIRNQIVQLIKSGHTKEELSEKFGIHTSTIYRIASKGGCKFDRTKKLDVNITKTFVHEHPHMLLKEIATHFNVSAPGLCQFLKRHNISFETNWRKKLPDCKLTLENVDFYLLENPGLKMEEYASAFNVSVATFKKFLHKFKSVDSIQICNYNEEID